MRKKSITFTAVVFGVIYILKDIKIETITNSARTNNFIGGGVTFLGIVIIILFVLFLLKYFFDGE